MFRLPTMDVLDASSAIRTLHKIFSAPHILKAVSPLRKPSTDDACQSMFLWSSSEILLSGPINSPPALNPTRISILKFPPPHRFLFEIHPLPLNIVSPIGIMVFHRKLLKV